MSLGRLGGKECSGGWLRHVLCRGQSCCPDLDLVAWVSCRVKAPHSGVDGDDAPWCRDPLKDVIGFRVNCLVRPGLDSGNTQCCFPLLRSLSWNLGVLGCVLTLYSGLPVLSFDNAAACVCKRATSPPCIPLYL
jgi:hypothetical protein